MAPELLSVTPWVATGAMILTFLRYEMRRRNARNGILTICGGGGMGVSGVVERK